jgi:hypothetical protein
MSIKVFFTISIQWSGIHKSSAFLSTVVGFFPLFVIQVDAKEIGMAVVSYA